MSLPQEIVTQIMSYLDSTSLINASLVSHVWHNSSDTSYLWKHLFYAEAGFSCPPNEREMRIIKDDGSGMGNGKPDQEWKKMWKVRSDLSYAAPPFLSDSGAEAVTTAMVRCICHTHLS